MSITSWGESEKADHLLRQAEEGDDAALDELLAMHRPALVRFVGVRLHPRLRARVDESDVVQEAFHEAARRIPDFLQNRPMPFRLWLRQIAYDRLVMEQRRHLNAACRAVSRETLISDESSVNLFSQLLADGSSPSMRICRAEAVELLRGALASLSKSDHELVLMRMTENMPYDDIGLMLGCTAETARKRYTRALARLYQELKAHGWSRHE